MLAHRVDSIGIDEVGRGPGFGRLYTAAVLFQNTDINSPLIVDSKKLSYKKLLEAESLIKEHATAWVVDYADVDEINREGVLKANMNSMNRCVATLLQRTVVRHLLVDGNYYRNYHSEETIHETVVKGDSKFVCIAAASILAKVARDRYILQLCERHPELEERYGLASNKGYVSAKHRLGLERYGYTAWHRSSWSMFEPYKAAKPKPFVRRKEVRKTDTLE